mmetsp:Transcript_32679/g.56868  ORF Transcript_32679/g.56868 Transcript_32679/m.56868 type:complete len:1121 (+) Transcript_32679:74-3436(+)
MRWCSAALLSWVCVSTQSEDEGPCMAQLGCLAEPWSSNTARSMLNMAARTEILKQRLVEKELEQTNEENLVFTNWSLTNWSDASEAAQDLVFTNWSLENLTNASFAEAGQDALKPPELEQSIGKDGKPKGHPLQTFVKAQCHMLVYAPGGSCPRDCPFFAEDNDKHCFFQCVKASECGKYNPDHRVADEEGFYCRGCKVAGCSVCAAGPLDQCAECNLGYILQEDGTCASRFAIVWRNIFIGVGVLAVFLLLWLLHIACHPTTNAEGLQEALSFRSSLKLHVPKYEETQVFRNLDQRGSSGRQLWPLHTNLHTEQVAGPGLSLHFNFQLYNIIWAGILVTIWLIFVFYTDSRQLSLGLESLMVDPRMMCTATLSGKSLYDMNIQWKAVFLIIIYVVTFISCIVYTFVQQYYYDVSSDDVSMEDYAALCTGLPPLPGTGKWEERLQEAIQRASKQNVVGVSICWNFEKHGDIVQEVLERDIVSLEPFTPQVYHLPLQDNLDTARGDQAQEEQQERGRKLAALQEQARAASPEDQRDLEARMKRLEDAARDSGVSQRVTSYERQFTPEGSPRGQVRRISDSRPMSPRSDMEGPSSPASPVSPWLKTGATARRLPVSSHEEPRAGFSGKIDSALMNFFGFGSAGAAPKEVNDDGVKTMLDSQVSSNSAFVVFETEAARDSAVEEMKRGIAFQGGLLTFEKAAAIEPHTTRWEAFAVTNFTFVSRILIGFLIMITSTLLWACCFYLPYAYFNSMFSYQSGEEPGAAEIMVFSLIVTAGNQVMYQICAAIGEWIGFTSRDGVEGAFVALYFFAITLQVLLDLVVEGYIGWVAMLANGTHTADGRPLEELTNFEQIFASYPVQVVLGKRLFAYCCPGTFLLPFLIEPLGAVFMPYYVCKLLVRTHPEVRGREAEKALMFFTPMDMGRYGDILLNVMLAVLVFFFPSGQILKLFLVYIVSHIWIYMYDHYKVLRAVPAFYYASNSMDLYVQMLLAVPCATLAACIVFKGNCVTNMLCFRGNLGYAVAAAFVGHLVFHWLALLTAVRLAKRLHRHKVQEVPYSEAASRTPANWFSSNPIHCLRSKYVYKHSPPCDYWIQGKEHLIRKNPKIGVYYEDKAKTVVEDYQM